MPPFVTIPREYASDYRNGRLSKQELFLLLWLRLSANPYGIATVEMGSLAIDYLSKNSKNYINKLLLDLKRKRYIYYGERTGRRGSFEIHLDYWPLPNKGKTGLPGVARLARFFDADDEVRGPEVDEVTDEPEVRAEVDAYSQRSDGLKNEVNASQKGLSAEPIFRGNDTDTETKKENEINTSFKGSENSRKKGSFVLSEFYPENRAEVRLFEIAEELGEVDMRFLVSSAGKYGLATVELTYVEAKRSEAWGRVEGRSVLFNTTLQQLINRRNP